MAFESEGAAASMMLDMDPGDSVFSNGKEHPKRSWGQREPNQSDIWWLPRSTQTSGIEGF